MLLELRQLRIQPGQQLLLEDVSWQQFENILAELGEHRAARISYSHGFLEIMVPLPEHEKAKEIIGDLVKILLEARQIAFESLGSTTLKNDRMAQGVEPDACFYIQNQTRTQLDNYQILGVPELWRYGKQGLQIHVLENGKYVESNFSPTFPDIPIIELVNQYVQQSQVSGRTQAIQAFRNWLRDNI
jgi:hypothetical protein